MASGPVVFMPVILTNMNVYVVCRNVYLKHFVLGTGQTFHLLQFYRCYNIIVLLSTLCCSRLLISIIVPTQNDNNHCGCTYVNVSAKLCFVVMYRFHKMAHLKDCKGTVHNTESWHLYFKIKDTQMNSQNRTNGGRSQNREGLY